MIVSAVLSVATLSHSAPALRYLAVLYLSCYLDGSTCFIHGPDVPCCYFCSWPKCQKRGLKLPFDFYESPRWRPFLSQVNFLVCCCRCFCYDIFYRLSRWRIVSRGSRVPSIRVWNREFSCS
jgi:hypothetical protein